MNSFTKDEESSNGNRDERLVPDFLQANDWKFGWFAVLVLTLQAIVLLLIFLDGYGLVPLYLREFVTFLFYSYIPGLVLLRALRVHNIGQTLTTLLSVALSIVLLMFVGFALNIAYLRFSGPVPFELPTILLAQTITIFLLCGLAYISDRKYSSEPKFDISPLISAPAFALYSLPLVAVLSTYVLNGWNIAIFQIVLILLVATAALTILVKRIPTQLYPVAVVCIAIAVIFHTALVSRFPVEWADVSQEYWSAKSTLIQGHWEPTAFGRTNSVLSVTILAPMYFLLCGLDLNLIFKVCYPLLFCLVPLGVFLISYPRFGARPAFLSAFLIISGTVFFTEFLGLGRQVIAELMLVAILTTAFYSGKRFAHTATITCILFIGLAVSHYGTLAIVAPCALIGGIMYLISQGKSIDRKTLAQIVSSAIVVVIPSISWYVLVPSQRVIASFKRAAQSISDGLGNTFDPFNGLLGTILMPQEVSSQLWLMAVLQLLFIFFSAYGMVRIWISRTRRIRWGVGFLIISSIFMFISVTTLFNLNLFNEISTSRFYHICLFFMAPLAICGGISSFNLLKTKKISPKKGVSTKIVAVGSLLTIGFLINTGVVSFVIGEPLPVQFDMNINDRPMFTDGEWAGAQFSIAKGYDSETIVTDSHRAYLLDMVGGRYDPMRGTVAPPIKKEMNLHYFLSSENLEGMLWLENPDYSRINKNYVPMSEAFNEHILTIDKVYASQESELYYKKF